MHLYPDTVLPFAQLQRARAARHPKMPVTAAGGPSLFALASNHQAASAALLEDLPGGEREIKFEHDRSAGSATDAVADVGGLRRVDHPDDLQLDPRRQHLEQPTAATEQHRDLMNLHFVQHTCLE